MMTVACAMSGPHYTDMEEEQRLLQEVLRAHPGSIRTLAEAAGVSEKLLRMIRDGKRRLTPDVRDALVIVLRDWERRLGEAAEALEAADLEEGGSDG